MQTMSPNAAAPPPLPPKTRKKAHVVSIRVSSAQSAPQITASDDGGCVRISVNRLPVGYYLYNGFKCADHIEDAIVSPTPPSPPPKSTSVRVTVNGEDKKRIKADTKSSSPELEKKNAIIETRNGTEPENPPEKRNGTVVEPGKKNDTVIEIPPGKRNGTVTEPVKKNGTVTEPEKNGLVTESEKRNRVVTEPEKNGVVTEPEKNDEPERKNGIVTPENLPEATTNGIQGTKCQSLVSEAESQKGNSGASPNSTMKSAKRRSSPKVVEERTYEERKAPVAVVTYDADHYYDFHLHEAQPASGEQANGGDDFFAGCRSFGLQESSIKSSKGTIRGVRNRVRAGVATFLQMQSTQPFAAKEAGQVVVYTTTMGIVRATAQRCARVRQILRTLLVRFDERDLFMSRDAQAELQSRLGTTGLPQLPQVFVEGRLLGDAETVERLNESGELRKMLKPYKSPDAATPCEVCGGYRLLPCAVCNGSKKSVHRNHFTAELVALRCMNCDEVGLVRCYAC